MLYLLVSLAALSSVGLLMLVRAVFTAPEGFEDAKGFHAVHRGEDAALATEAAPATPVPVSLNDLLYLDKQMASQTWH